MTSEMFLVAKFGEIWILKEKTKISNCTVFEKHKAAKIYENVY